MQVTACDDYRLRMRVKRGERGGWKKGTWGRRVEREDGGCTRKRGRVESKGRVTDQHNRHCQPTRSSRFYVWIWISPLPSPGPGPEARPDHSYYPPPSHFSFFNCFRPHRAFCHPPLYLVSSIRHRSASTPGHLLLCHFVGSSSACQHSRLRTQWRTTHRFLRHARTGVLSYFRRCKAQSTSAFIVHYRVPDLLFLLYRRIYIANALLSSRPEHSPYFIS
jgi:hypothetical protein